MNTWVRRSLSAGALTAGAVMATGATAAHADTTMISNDNTGILNGTQVYAPIQAPINLCGVAAAVGGKAAAGCEGGSAASIHGLYDATMITHDNTGVLNGTQVFAPIQVPVNVCGVAVAVLGDAAAGCEGGASATHGKGKHGKGKHGKKDHYRGGSHDSKPAAEVLGTNVAGLPATNLLSALPVGQALGGVSQSVSGGGLTESGREEGYTAPPSHGGGEGGRGDDCPPGHHHGHRGDVTMISSGNVGILNGTQVYAPIQVPVDVSGVAVAVLGHASAWSVGGSSARG